MTACIMLIRIIKFCNSTLTHCRVYVWLRDAIARAGSDLYLGLS